MVNAGISERVAMQITGHRTREVFMRYQIVSPGDLQDAARKMARTTAVQNGAQLPPSGEASPLADHRPAIDSHVIY